jgi:NAD(P)-dependent dehydrogenase (short-subunit alcohol dehydrogenase family)
VCPRLPADPTPGGVGGTRAALARLGGRDRGVIVQVGSALAERGIPKQSAYCGAKHAMEGVLDALRSELLDEGSAVHVATVHLPAVNTPQFVWNRAKVDRHPRPVPPVFQPEVAARAVRDAVVHRRREVWLGWPTVQTIAGERLLPSALADRYLARNAIEAQVTDEPIDADERLDNLFEPADVDLGARGPFDADALDRSLHYELSRRRGLLALGATLLLGGGAWLLGRRRGAA